MPSPLNDSTGDGNQTKTNPLQTTPLPGFITAKALEQGMDVMGNGCNPPPGSIGVKVVARKNTTSKVAFQHSVNFLAMAATLVVPRHKLCGMCFPIGHKGMDFIAPAAHVLYRKRAVFFCGESA